MHDVVRWPCCYARQRRPGPRPAHATQIQPRFSYHSYGAISLPKSQHGTVQHHQLLYIHKAMPKVAQPHRQHNTVFGNIAVGRVCDRGDEITNEYHINSNFDWTKSKTVRRADLGGTTAQSKLPIWYLIGYIFVITRGEKQY